MQRFQFRLETLLHYRTLQKNIAQSALGQAEIAWRAANEELTALHTKKEQLEDILRDTQTEHIKVESLIFCHTYGLRLKTQITHQQEAVAVADEQRIECRRQLVEAQKKQKLVEKLKANRLSQYNTEILAQEQKELDEIGLQLYARGE